MKCFGYMTNMKTAVLKTIFLYAKPHFFKYAYTNQNDVFTLTVTSDLKEQKKEPAEADS